MEPEPLPRPDSAPSLADRLGAGWRARGEPGAAGSWRIALILAVMLPIGPVLTIGASQWLAARERAAAVALAQSPAGGAAVARRAEAAELARLGPASLSDTLERFARVLPPDARLVSLQSSRGDSGDAGLSAEVAAGDPDSLRAALSRDPLTARLRSVNERRGDGVMIVTLELPS